jgi:CRISPR-associated protein Cas2
MTVVVLTAVPPGLRGHLTRWLLEISPGVFVGYLSARVRDRMWERIAELMETGRALMVYSARNEQHLTFRVHGHDWSPVDFDGITLMRRREDQRSTATGALHPAPKLPVSTDPAVKERRRARMKFKNR